MLSDASLVSGDSNSPAGGPAVVLRRHHHLRSVTSPQAPSLPALSKCQTPLSPLRPSPSGRGASWHITLFLLNPCCHSDLTSSSFSLPAICSSFLLVPCFFWLRYSLDLLLSTDFDIHPSFLRLHANCICQRGQMLTHEFR